MCARKTRRESLTAVAVTAVALFVMACGSAPRDEAAGEAPAASLAGRISVDGSATVLPVSKAMADAFQKTHPGVQVLVESSGTGGGFKKFCAGQVDVTGASRPINAAESRECEASHTGYIELPVAFDSLSVVVNAKNSFVDCLTTGELNKMWEPAAEGSITQWSQIRSGFPSQPLALFGPGRDSGTFDYFTLAIVGTESRSRSDYTKSEDDTVLVNGVAQDPAALGYFGYAYYLANKDKLKAVAIDSGHGCVAPSPQTVADNSYQPLSRPIFVYISTSAAARPEGKAFARFYVDPDNSSYVRDVGYVPLPAVALLIAARRLDQNETGSIFGGRGSVLGLTTDSFRDEDRIKNALVQ